MLSSSGVCRLPRACAMYFARQWPRHKSSALDPSRICRNQDLNQDRNQPETALAKSVMDCILEETDLWRTKKTSTRVVLGRRKVREAADGKRAFSEDDPEIIDTKKAKKREVA